MEMRPIPGFDGYFAGADGYIYSSRGCGDGRIHTLKRKQSRPQNSGYFYVSLVTMHRGKRQPVRFSVHRLVCTAWHGEPKPSQECRHLRHKRDNRPCVLRWGTKGQNQFDKARKKNNVKLSSKLVLGIRLQIMEGLPYADVAKLHGVCYQTIYYIAEGIIWRSPRAIPKGFRDWQRLHLMRGTTDTGYK